MKREIKFRGLRVDGKGWIYGYYFYDKKVLKSYIIDDEANVDVFSESVCQFTGLQDAKGIDVYEGDVVQDIFVGLKSEIVFTTYANFGLRSLNNEVKYLEFDTIDDSFSSTTLEVIGNIHEQK